MLKRKTRKKTSVIWVDLDDEKFTKLVEESSSMKGITDFFGISNQGGNFVTIKERIKHLNLNIDHFMNANQASHYTQKMTKDRFITEWLIDGQIRNNTHFKKYLFKFSILDDKCNACGCGNEWNGCPLVLQLDHIDGNSSNNKLDNLRILCPNCHTQTKTFAGKNKKNRTIV